MVTQAATKKARSWAPVNGNEDEDEGRCALSALTRGPTVVPVPCPDPRLSVIPPTIGFPDGLELALAVLEKQTIARSAIPRRTVTCRVCRIVTSVRSVDGQPEE
jgi:hypothetical protein